MNIRGPLQKIHFGLVSILFIAITILLYSIVSKFHARWNLKRALPVKIAQETESLLKRFPGPVTLKAFFSVDDPRLPDVRALLEEFKKAKPDLNFVVIDPDQHPKEAERYKIDQYGALIAETSKKKIQVQGRNEEEIAASLLKLLSSKVAALYFIKGHHEASLHQQTENGYSELYKRLKSLRYQCKNIEIGNKPIPADAAMVLVMGPHADFGDDELTRLGNYLQNGGKVLVAIDPVLPGEGEKLAAFLSKWGVGLGADAVVDGLGKELSGDYLTAAGVELTEREAFLGLESPVLMPLARSVRKTPLVAKNIEAAELLRTSDRAWAETSLDDLAAGKTHFDEGLDYPGPIPLAVISRIQAEKPGILMVLGDSEAFNNSHLRIGSNQGFLLKLITLALGEKFEIKEKKSQAKIVPFVLTPKREVILFGSSVVLAPAIFIFIGIGIYWARRKQA